MNLVKWYKTCVKEAGISGQKTNHSFRATSASQLFQANVPEIIQERTGYRSTDALRLYERTTEQHKGVTQVLSSNLDISYTFVFQQCKAFENHVSMPQPMQQPTNIAPTLNQYEWVYS